MTNNFGNLVPRSFQMLVVFGQSLDLTTLLLETLLSASTFWNLFLTNPSNKLARQNLVRGNQLGYPQLHLEAKNHHTSSLVY